MQPVKYKKCKAYIICPVRAVAVEQISKLESYVNGLELLGREVHYPMRDVDQTNVDGGIGICYCHREAMAEAEEVHVLWDLSSTGSHFDLGMAFAVSLERVRQNKPPIDFFLINKEEDVQELDKKSFQNLLLQLVCPQEYRSQE